jgi:hypothetical protein
MIEFGRTFVAGELALQCLTPEERDARDNYMNVERLYMDVLPDQSYEKVSALVKKVDPVGNRANWKFISWLVILDSAGRDSPWV